MKRTLLLNQSGFPRKFIEVEIEPPNNTSKEMYVKNEILNSINSYNPKLNIAEIEYVNLRDQFPNVQNSIYSGLVVEDIEINEENKNEYTRKGFFVWDNHDKFFARRIIIYVFFSQSTEAGRDILPQSIFPPLIDYMEDFNSAPSYLITNHPVYYINIINKQITANIIITDLAGVVVLDFGYIEVFAKSLEPQNVPLNIESFVKKYEGCEENSTSFMGSVYEIDFSSKKLKFKANKLVVGDYLKRKTSGELEFKGSSEKFYWMKTLTLFNLALKSGYDIDFLEIEQFYNENVNEFGESKKIKRFLTIVNYMKKLTFYRGDSSA